jgi:hypothetical protein
VSALLLPLLWACAQEPVALPPSALPPMRARGRMVKSGRVRGYLVPDDRSSTATLWAVDVLDDDARAAAEALGGRVLLVGPGVDLDAAGAYLEGTEGAPRLTLRCERHDC